MSEKKLQFYYRNVNQYKAFRPGGSFYSEIHILDHNLKLLIKIPQDHSIHQIANEEQKKLIHEKIKEITNQKYILTCII